MSRPNDRLSIEPLIDTAAIAVARVSERSNLVREVVRRVQFRGKHRIVSHIRPCLLPPELIAGCLNSRFKLNLADKLQRLIYFNLHEVHDLQTLLPHIPRNGICLDVGAHVGFYTLHFARRVADKGVVHAFEPDPDNFRRLTENVRLNSFGTQIYPHPMAVTNRSGVVSFYRSDRAWSGLGSLVKFPQYAVATTEVEATTLDHFLDSHGIKRVDCLKIDVEAAEFEVLEGAVHSLKNRVFRHIFIEFNGFLLAERSKSLADFLELFRTHGYKPIGLNLVVLQQMLDGQIPPETQLVNLMFEATGFSGT